MRRQRELTRAERRRAVVGFLPAGVIGVLLSVAENELGWSFGLTLAVGCVIVAVMVPVTLLYIFQPWRD